MWLRFIHCPRNRNRSGCVNHAVCFQATLMGRPRDRAHRTVFLKAVLDGAPPLFRPFRQVLNWPITTATPAIFLRAAFWAWLHQRTLSLSAMQA